MQTYDNNIIGTLECIADGHCDVHFAGWTPIDVASEPGRTTHTFRYSNGMDPVYDENNCFIGLIASSNSCDFYKQVMQVIYDAGEKCWRATAPERIIRIEQIGEIL